MSTTTKTPSRAEALIERINERLDGNARAVEASADGVLRSRLGLQKAQFEDILRWLPLAIDLDAKLQTYGCRDSRGLHLPCPPEIVDPPIRFRRNTFTTSDPIAKARIEYHMREGHSPAIEKIPRDHVPNFNDHGVFLMWSDRDTHRDMIQRGAAEPNL